MEIEKVVEEAGAVWVDVLWPQEGPVWRIRLAFGSVEGRVRCTGLCVLAIDSGLAFSASRLRKLPIALLIDAVLSDPPRELIRLAGLQPFNSLADLREAGLSLLREQEHEGMSGRGRPVVYGPEHYADVARIYAENPRKPTQAVADAFKVKRTTAANWVRKARELGLLDSPHALTVRGN